jgi:hypothetical protein
MLEMMVSSAGTRVANVGTIVMLPVVVIPYWKIFSKAGFLGWLSLLIILPFINLIVLYFVAFSEWKTTIKPQGVSSTIG